MPVPFYRYFIKFRQQKPYAGCIGFRRNFKFYAAGIWFFSNRTREDLKGALEQSIDHYQQQTRKTEARNRPIQLAEKATGFLESIDLNILSRLGDSELQRLRRQLDLLEKAADEIRRKLS